MSVIISRVIVIRECYVQDLIMEFVTVGFVNVSILGVVQLVTVVLRTIPVTRLWMMLKSALDMVNASVDNANAKLLKKEDIQENTARNAQ